MRLESLWKTGIHLKFLNQRDEENWARSNVMCTLKVKNEQILNISKKI